MNIKDTVVADDIYKYLLTKGNKTERAVLYKQFWRTISYDVLSKTLKSLHQAGLIEVNKVYIYVRKET